MERMERSNLDWFKSSMFEWIDFSNPSDLNQKRKIIFKNDTGNETKVNGLATCIWCETHPGYDNVKSLSDSRLARTAFPYGDAHLKSRLPDRLDFSSRFDDEGAAATNWRNVFLEFPATIHIQNNEKLRIDSECILTHFPSRYFFTVYVNDIYQFKLDIENFYPTFTQCATIQK